MCSSNFSSWNVTAEFCVSSVPPWYMLSCLPFCSQVVLGVKWIPSAQQMSNFALICTKSWITTTWETTSSFPHWVCFTLWVWSCLEPEDTVLNRWKRYGMPSEVPGPGSLTDAPCGSDCIFNLPSGERRKHLGKSHFLTVDSGFSHVIYFNGNNTIYAMPCLFLTIGAFYPHVSTITFRVHPSNGLFKHDRGHVWRHSCSLDV